MERLFRAIDTAAPGAARTPAGSLAAAPGGKPRLRIGAATPPADREDEEAAAPGIAGSAGFRLADFLRVAPGLRPVRSRPDDRTRIVTPRAAAARIAEEMVAAIG